MRHRICAVVIAALVCALLTLVSGCAHHRSIFAPPPLKIDPADYSTKDYQTDNDTYKAATTPGTGANPDLAKQARNNTTYGLMADINAVYGNYFAQLFGGKAGVAVAGDFLTLGLSSAATIATHSATKTIFSALGTGLSGLALSVDKNYFTQQSFGVIGVAMQTRRDKVRATIVANLALDTVTYPVLAAKRDLVAYLYAGTLPGGLQELQEEAGAATAVTPASAGANKPSPPAAPSGEGGDSQISLVWTASPGATSYNIYYSTTTGVSPANGTKIPNVTTNSYTHKGLTSGTTYYYVLTAVNANAPEADRESSPSPEVSATPNLPARGEPSPVLTPH